MIRFFNLNISQKPGDDLFCLDDLTGHFGENFFDVGLFVAERFERIEDVLGNDSRVYRRLGACATGALIFEFQYDTGSCFWSDARIFGELLCITADDQFLEPAHGIFHDGECGFWSDAIDGVQQLKKFQFTFITKAKETDRIAGFVCVDGECELYAFRSTLQNVLRDMHEIADIMYVEQDGIFTRTEDDAFEVTDHT